MLIREAKVQDAPAFVALFDRINSETTFMLFEHGESPTTVEQQARIFEHWAKTDSGVMFVCEEDKELIGLLQAGAVLAAVRLTRSISLWASYKPGLVWA